MSENADTDTSPPTGPYDVFLAYTYADEDIAKALQSALHRLRPGLRVWCEKSRLGVADAFNQSTDEAISSCGVVLAIWTPHAARTNAFMLEARRALTLRKPFVNLLAGVQTSSLTPPLSKYSAFSIDHLAIRAGRSQGWLPPRQPSAAELDEELRPILTKVLDFLRMVGTPAADISEGLIGGVLNAAGTPHSAGFDSMLKSVAPGDPATALEVLLLSGYSEAEINTLISPQRAKIADTSGERPAWGAWHVRPHVRKLAPLHKDNGALYALGGFVVAALGAAMLWFIGSTLSAGSSQAPGNAVSPGIDTAASNPTVQPSRATPAQPEADPVSQPEELPVCTLNSDGSITGAECRLTADIAPRPRPAAPPTEPVGEPAMSDLDGCIIRLDGSIRNTPCRLAAPYTIPDSGEDTAECVVNPDGSITDVPCRLIGTFQAPEPVEVEVPAEAVPPKLCIRNPDGSITDVPCMVASPTSAPEPERIEVPAEPIIEDLPVCDTPQPGEEIAPGCKIGTAFQRAHATCDENYANLPCTLTRAPIRLASDDASPAATLRTGNNGTSETVPNRPQPPLTPIDMPENLDPCEEAIVAPCQFTVSNAGLFTLSEIAQSFYGDREAWCMVYRANQRTFGTRNQPRVADDPNCIFSSDVLDLPRPQDTDAYNLRGCPPAKQVNRCLAPIER